MNPVVEKKIIISITVSQLFDWRKAVQELASLEEREIALFLEGSSTNERRELYRSLEAIDDLLIPYVDVSTSMESWEFDYLTSTFKTSFFCLPTSNRAFSFIASVPKYLSSIIFKNPSEKKFKSIFTDESLTRANIGGVCLDVATLEYNRQHDEKIYESTIHVLDHHVLQATVVRPLSDSFLKRLIKPFGRHLTSLVDLHYIRYVQPLYLSSLIVIDVENEPAEQLEIKAYLRGIIK